MLRRRRSRRGALLILALLMLFLLAAMVAFSLDVAYMELTNTRLRVATDAAARASGAALSREQSTAAARQAAKDIAAANPVAGAPLELGDEDIEFGHSSRKSGGQWKFTAGSRPLNSVRISGRRTRDSLSGSVPLFFGRMLGTFDYQPTASATAVLVDRDICLVVDRSSSMKLDRNTTSQTMSLSDPRFRKPPEIPDSRWAAAVEAVQVFIETLEQTPQTEYIGLASFASDCEYVGVVNKRSSTDQPITNDPQLILDALANHTKTRFNGATNTSAGIDEGVRVLTDKGTARPLALKTMVFLTDGFRTEGGSPVPVAEQAARDGITIHTVTFGADFNQSEMIAVAAATGGKHYHAPDPDSLAEIFREIALTLPVVLGQ